MAELCIVLVEPKHQCNVGFVARAMKNFGFQRLYFSGKAFTPGSEAYACAAHARDVLAGAAHLGSRPLSQLFDLVVGSTSKHKTRESSPRNAVSPRELATLLSGVEGRVALVFGREDRGLSDSELDACDLVLSIPASEGYPTLNLSHAVAIVLYELALSNAPGLAGVRKASGREKEALLQRLGQLLESLGYPNYKKKVVERIFKRVIGRAVISGREAHTLAGIFKEAKDEIERRRQR